MTHFPPLHLDDWESTRHHVQGYTQVLAKIRATLTPPQKYQEHTTLYTTATGLTTTPMPIGYDTVEMRLDFFGNLLILTTSRGEIWQKPLLNISPAELYTATVEIFAELGVTLNPNHHFNSTKPVDYQVESVEKFWQILAPIDSIFKQFAGEITTETTPVVFVPERFELVFHNLFGINRQLTFSFSTGNLDVGESYFCVTATPQPEGFLDIVLPQWADWNSRGFQGAVMKYETFRQANDPKTQLLTFLRTIQQNTFALIK